MKKSEFKQILKPLIKECIQESLLEDGLISGIIGEVVRGMNRPPAVVETQAAAPSPVKERMQRNAFSPEQSGQLRENKRKLMSAIGGGAYNGVNLFEGTTPTATQPSPTQQASPLSGQPPGDPGVDISNLFGAVGKNWNAHMNDVKEEK